MRIILVKFFFLRYYLSISLLFIFVKGGLLVKKVDVSIIFYLSIVGVFNGLVVRRIKFKFVKKNLLLRLYIIM